MNANLKNGKQPLPPKSLTDFEWTLLWMAIRYAMNRQTIASATLPEDIMRNWYKRLTNGQKQQIVSELAENEETMSRMGHTAFGNPDIDRPHWLRLWACLDESKHYEVELIDGRKLTVFNVGDIIAPLDKYIEWPHRMYSVPLESIRQGRILTNHP